MALMPVISVASLSTDLLLGPLPVNTAIATIALVLTILAPIPIIYMGRTIAKVTRPTVSSQTMNPSTTSLPTRLAALMPVISVASLSIDLLLGPLPVNAAIATIPVVPTALAPIPITHVPQRIAKVTRPTVGP